jgi:hypothetical protein
MQIGASPTTPPTEFGKVQSSWIKLVLFYKPGKHLSAPAACQADRGWRTPLDLSSVKFRVAGMV